MKGCSNSWKRNTSRPAGEEDAMSYVASPSVRSYAAERGVDLDRLAQETGRETLAREDVDRKADGAGSGVAPGPAPDAARYWDVDHAAFGPVTEDPLSRIARVAADNLSAANSLIPQVTHHDSADMRAVEAFRKGLRDEARDRGTRLTALAFHVRVLARCLREFPRFNASLDASGETLVLKDYVHVGIAVDTPNGLMVPVIRDADRKGLWEIAAEITDLSRKAQGRKLRAEEMGGASMTISNLGGIGGSAFTPIVNPPEVAILGITRSQVTPVWEGEWVPVPLCPLDLSYDHRVINGADAARFLSRYATLMADPRRMLI
ncbi:dihydrolipoamide acetyltransferase [Thioclava sp. F42-5]|nr:dihydrolipoamide acetyltransferase [Thioclava sp. F42-5]